MKDRPVKHHARAGHVIPCGFCGATFRTYKLRYRHGKDCPHPEGKKKTVSSIVE